MGEIERCLDAGVDAVDIRVANHNRTFDWDAYGYNPIVLEELGAEPNGIALRKCLGKHYTRFLHDARKLITSRGKQMFLHLDSAMQEAPFPCSMNMAMEWRSWLESGMADEVTLMSHSAIVGEMPAMIAAARSAGCKINLRPYFITASKGPRAAETIDLVINDALAAGVDALNLYENVCFFGLDESKRAMEKRPNLLERFAPAARRSKNGR